MHTKRIIPCLDVKDGKVVKGINFKGLINVGDPVELGKYYYEAGADELVFLDVTATNEGRGCSDPGGRGIPDPPSLCRCARRRERGTMAVSG